MVRLPRVEGTDELGVRDVVRPVDAQGEGRAAQAADGAVGAAGRVRRMPVPAASMRSAAAMPVSREIWAFQPSAGSGAR